MTKVVITHLKVENIASIPALEINPDGADVFITGQNGAGKSTIQKAIDWVLTGNTSDGEKLIPRDGSGFPLVEIELMAGDLQTKISKEMVETKKGDKITRSVNCYLAGMPTTQKDLNAFLGKYAPINAVPLLLNPFEFFKLNTETRREMLTAIFGNVTDEQVLASDESLAEFDLANFPRVKNLIRKLKKAAQDIPVRIETLKNQICEEENTDALVAELEKLERCKQDAEKALADWNSKNNAILQNADALKVADAEIKNWQWCIEDAKRRIAFYEKRRAELLEKWRRARDGVCPTCGQALKNGGDKALLEKIVREGQDAASEIEKSKSMLANAEKKLAEWKAKAEKLFQEMPSSEDDRVTENLRLNHELAQWKREIQKRESRIATADYQRALNAKNQKEIDALAAREIAVGREIAACEKQIALNEIFIARRNEMISDTINSHFRYVNFQMFEVAKSGEVKNACTVTMHGVPFELLSKGEKMKAALDVLNALQDYYEVEFPLIIDDAESYTSNSITDITENQKFILQVAENQELKISLVFEEEEGARTA